MTLKVSTRLLMKEPMRRCCLGDCHGACCLHGVWMDTKEKDLVLEKQDLIREFMRPQFRDSQLWFDGESEPDPFTPSGTVHHCRVVPEEKHYGGTTCIFWREDAKCALQVAAQEKSMHPWYLKPFYCILHPLDLDEKGRITLDKTELLLDEPGSCLRSADEPVSLLITFEGELRFFLGNEKYENLLALNLEQ